MATRFHDKTTAVQGVIALTLTEVSTSLIYKWRRQTLAMESGAAFAPAIVVDEPASAAPEAVAITVEFGGGARVRISATAPVALVTTTLRALR